MTAGGVEALEELLRVAGHIERLHRLGRQRFDEDELHDQLGRARVGASE